MKIKNTDRLFKSEKWISNGHWMVQTKMSYRVKAIERLLNLQNGAYCMGLKYGADLETPLPDFEAVIPKDATKEVKFTGLARMNPDIESLEVTAFVLKCESQEIGVNPNYADLLLLGEAKSSGDPKDPIAIFNQGEVIAVVMPMDLEAVA
jgi:hypothetical protein